jgi:PAS domain S-box-containing protein
VVVSPDGRIRNLNLATLRASGHADDEEVRGRLFWDVFIDPDERREMQERFEAAAPDFPSSEYENTFTNARGELHVIAWESAPVVDEQGQVVSIVAGGLDITDRKQREVELERESTFLRTVAGSIESLLAVVDEDGVVVGHSVNPAFEARLGWNEDEMRGRSLVELFAPEERAAALDRIRAAAAGTAVPERESRWTGLNGGQIDVAWIATPVVDPSGNPQVLVSGTDITERNRHQEEISASRARILQAADDARRRLERDLHDGAQQRLVALSLSLRLGEAKLRSDPEGAATILAGAREELAHALGELRELARGIHPAVLTERGLSAAVEGLVARTPLAVHTELADDRLPAPVEAAAYFVVAEALTNVAKYAGATSAHVRVRADDGVVTVEVADDGVGGADPASGSGLRGLADRVAALDGSLRIESPPGQGTRVVATLPVRSHALSR